MSEPTPVFDPPVLENETGAAEAEGSAATMDNGGSKDNRGQDVTMAGLGESGVKPAAKTGADPATKMASHNTDGSHNTNGILGLHLPSPTGSFRSLPHPGLVHLRVPSDFLSKLSSGNNNPATTATTASSSTNPPTPNRTSTPTGSREGVPARLDNSSSRAASAAPADRTADRVTMPTEPAAHGAPTRQYLNSKVTYHVMEGMKIIAKEQPADPLRVLGEFLLKRSAELEGAATNGTAAAASAPEGDKDKAENGADAPMAEQ